MIPRPGWGTYRRGRPLVATVSPNSGLDSGGLALTIRGVGFTGATGVKIGGVACTSVVVVDDSTITCVSPAGATDGVNDVVVTIGFTLTGGFTESFTPLALPTLAAWYRADNYVAGTWGDQSGVGDSNRNALQATSTKRPTLNAIDAAFNNQPTLTFSRALLQMMVTGTWSSPLPNASTIFTVGKLSVINAGSVNHVIDGIDTSHRQVMASHWGTSNYELYAGSAFADSTVAPKTTAAIFSAIFSGAASKTFINSNTASATVSPGTNTALGLTIGSDFSESTSHFDGQIAEIIVCSSVLSGANIAKTHAYLSARYGITLV